MESDDTLARIQLQKVLEKSAGNGGSNSNHTSTPSTKTSTVKAEKGKKRPKASSHQQGNIWRLPQRLLGADALSASSERNSVQCLNCSDYKTQAKKNWNGALSASSERNSGWKRMESTGEWRSRGSKILLKEWTATAAPESPDIGKTRWAPDYLYINAEGCRFKIRESLKEECVTITTGLFSGVTIVDKPRATRSVVSKAAGWAIPMGITLWVSLQASQMLHLKSPHLILLCWKITNGGQNRGFDPAKELKTTKTWKPKKMKKLHFSLRNSCLMPLSWENVVSDMELCLQTAGSSANSTMHPNGSKETYSRLANKWVDFEGCEEEALESSPE
ncbi:hypothetical protein HAX54_000721 [Datura stramonium]|uniref:Uncharacterized protein n=1 Tax=Datura stramonium TaxID=4076 RepID=A0ABS8WT61_DATST|nr:hypothetical protein [Datura stramonium]